MLHYVYYPFPQSSTITANASVLKRYTAKYSGASNNTHDEQASSHSGSVLRYKGAMLNDIRDDDMLMISSHGGSTDPTTIISDKGVKEMYNQAERLTANDLAKQLHDAKLPVGHVLIKMLSCYASGVLTKGAEDITRTGMGEGGEEFFAKLLAVTMKKNFLYDDIIVGGYSGAFMNSVVAKTRFSRNPMSQSPEQYNKVSVEGGSPVDSRDHIYWVDGDGNYVDASVVKQKKLESDGREGKFTPGSTFQQSKGRMTVFKRG